MSAALAPTLALDRSMRTFDVDGRMRVAVSNISMAAINPYRGREIPGGVETLGLGAETVYMMLRCPEEMSDPEAVASFNGLPILDRHVPVTAEKPRQDLIVGSTGTHAEFVDPFMRNALVIWSGAAIQGIESEEQAQLSSAYHFKPDMTPGTWKSVHYDGIMRNLRGNHVCLVDRGRAGPKVIVADRAMQPYGKFLPLHSGVGKFVAPARSGRKFLR